MARMNQTVSETIAAHGGVRPVEQGEGDSFVAAFARASDAVACALELQRAPLAPIRLRIGMHTGEIQLRDEGNYAGPTINRTARLRDLGHGGQTLLSGATEALVLDRLPDDAWLSDLGTHSLRDLPRPERVMQLCHPDLVNDFPPLRVAKAVVSQRLPVQFTSFVGRDADLAQVRELLTQNRLVTLTGAGGVGKTRLAIQVAGQLAGEFADGVWYVDLAPITDPDLVPVTVARALGLPDQPGRSTMDTLHPVRRRPADAGGAGQLRASARCERRRWSWRCSAPLPGLTLLATSREPIGVAGEVSWRVPSLSLADEAVELFVDRARHARPDFAVTDDNAATVAEICRRLDGVPLAIELAAARVRALSLAEILDSLHDRFRLLTGGARTAVRRQQTLRASVDWSHALLTEPERVLFRRLAAFWAASTSTPPKRSPAVAMWSAIRCSINSPCWWTSRWWWPTTAGAEPATGCWRRCANTRWKNSASPARPTPCARVTAITTRRSPPCSTPRQAVITSSASSRPKPRSTTCAPHSRGAGKTPTSRLALALASSLQPLWQARGRIREGLTWFDTALADLDAHHPEVAPAVRARALADSATLGLWVGAADSPDQAQQALAIAREVDDPALLARALTACGYIAAYFDAEAARRVLGRGDRPGPGFGRPVEAQPDPRRASRRGTRGG